MEQHFTHLGSQGQTREILQEAKSVVLLWAAKNILFQPRYPALSHLQPTLTRILLAISSTFTGSLERNGWFCNYL